MVIDAVRHLVGCARRLLSPRPMTRDDHIRVTIAKVRRVDRKLDEYIDECRREGYCCPGCAFPEFRKMRAQQERRLAWLVILLKKRGEPDDMELAWDIEVERWPE